MMIGELRTRLLAARWCLLRELRAGAFKTWTILWDWRAMLSGDGKFVLVYGADPSNPHGVQCFDTDDWLTFRGEKPTV